MSGCNPWTTLPALLLVLMAVACTTPEAGQPVIDLLDLSPPRLQVEGEPLRTAPRRIWTLADGLPREWRPGPGSARVEQVPGGIRLSATQGAPFLEIDLPIDPLRYESLRVVFGEGEGEAAELFYAYETPPVYCLAGRVESRPLSPVSPHMRRFLLPHPDGAEGRLQAFRLYPAGRRGTDAVIREIRLVPRRDHFLQQAILSRDRIDLNQEFRRCWRVAGAGERRVTFWMPAEGGVLRFGTGTLLGGGRARLRLTADTHGRDAELLAVDFGRRGEGWTDHRLDLSSWAGERVTLKFSVESSDGSNAIRLIGAPLVTAGGGERRPDVVLVVIDTQRADRLSAYGHPERLTPNLDRLARAGLVFSRVRAPSSWTVPSTAALITGHYPEGPGMEGGRIPAVAPEDTTLAERFAGAGYATGGFSANFVLDGFRGFAQGFETWYLAPYQDAHLTARELNERALAWVADRGDEPLFLYLQYMDPHDPYDAPTPQWPRGRSAGEWNLARGHRWEDGSILPLIMGWDRLSGPEELMRLEGYYHGEVSFVDQALGHLLAALRAAGRLEETIVLVTADHGEELGDHGHWSHGYTLHREVLHVPLILSAPGLGSRAGTTADHPASLIDVVPTLADLAGLPPAADPGDGRNLLAPPAGDRPLFAATAACGLPARYSVFDGRYAYIRFDRPATADGRPGPRAARYLAVADPPAEALFDLDVDPLERDNLAEHLPEVASRLEHLLDTHFPDSNGGPMDPAPDGADLERLRALGYVQ